jgi:hypothetical protein
MSKTGLNIESALYGSGSSTVDVKSAVVSNVKDGELQLTVSPTSLGVQDPSSGQPNTLTVNYSINGGSTNTTTAKDGQVLTISAPPLRNADGLIITKAEYGYNGNWQDVTDVVENLISDSSLNIKDLSHDTVGLPDPNPQQLKILRLEYTLNGAPNSKQIKDGESFSISAPPSTQKDGKTLTSKGFDFIKTVYQGVLIFIGTFLHAVSIISAYRFGKLFISPIIVAIFAFIIPYFSFWLLPIIVFVVRLFSSSDYNIGLLSDSLQKTALSVEPII